MSKNKKNVELPNDVDMSKFDEIIEFDTNEYTNAPKGYVEPIRGNPYVNTSRVHTLGSVDELKKNAKRYQEDVRGIALDKNDENDVEWYNEDDIVNNPSHYTFSDKFEVIDVVEEITKHYPSDVAFAIGNVIKYVARAEHKNGVVDLKKSRFYLDRAIEKLEKGE